MPSQPIDVNMFGFEYSFEFRSVGSIFSGKLTTIEANREDADKRFASKLKKECIDQEDVISTVCKVKIFSKEAQKDWRRPGIIHFEAEPILTQE